MDPTETPRRSLPAAIFLLSFSTLALQVALLRVLSVSLWYHFAFMIVSVAVLGYGLSGMVLTLFPKLYEGAVHRRVMWMTGGLSISIGLSLVLINVIPFDPFRLLLDQRQLLWAPFYYLAITCPFFLSGLCVGLMLTGTGPEARRLYAWDLLGAGTGCVLVVFAFGPLGGNGTALATALLAALACWLLARREGRGERHFSTLLVLLAAAATSTADRWLPLRITEAKVASPGMSMAELLSDPRYHRTTEWNALSRVDVVEVSPDRRLILIDGGVAVVRVPKVTYPLDRASIFRDPTALPFHLFDAPSVLVMGSGGGWEVVGALSHHAREVTAVEVNPAINRLVKGPLAAWTGEIFMDPRVTLVTDEARSFLRRSGRTWDVIISAHTISNAATATGSLSLAESYTLTVEAFEDYLDHLTDKGVLYITRPEVQLPKLFRTARAVLLRRRLDPEMHLAALRTPRDRPDEPSFAAGFMLSRSPIDSSRRQRLSVAAIESALEVLYLPTSRSSEYRDILETRKDDGLAKKLGNLEPATDDRPFFNQRRRWRDLRMSEIANVFAQGTRGRLALEDRPIAEASMLVLLLLSVLSAGLCTLLPIFLRAGAKTLVFGAGRKRFPKENAGQLNKRQGENEAFAVPLRARSQSSSFRGGAAMFTYFSTLGLGFMFAELGLVHKLSLYIGAPTFTFATVVGALLFFSGLGAHFGGRFRFETEGRRVLLACVIVTLLFLAIGPMITTATLGRALGLRAVIAILLVAPVGFAVGMPFPLGLRYCYERARGLLPMVWSFNGFASVIASVVSLLLATVTGFSSVVLASAIMYGLAFMAISWELAHGRSVSQSFPNRAT